MFTRKWGTEILIAVWSIILVSLAIAFWKLYKTSRSLKSTAASSSNAMPEPQL